MKKNIIIILLAAGSLLLAGCQKTGLYDRGAVTFKAVSSVGTKTSYSGEDVTVGGKKYERLDWMQNDLIRIYSDAALTAEGDDWSDYVVTAAGVANGRYSTASIAAQNLSNSSDNGLLWGDAGDYNFYGIYPSGSYARGHQGIFQGVSIPAAQTPTFTEGVGAPDMSLAYMTAMESVTTRVDGEGVPVKLSFYPAFTAFQITLRSAAETLYLGSFSIQSDGDSPMAGLFNIDLNDTNDMYVPDNGAGETQSQITVDLNDRELTTEEDLTFTVFALPETYNDLSITFNVKQDLTDASYISRTLKLKTAGATGTYVTFPQCAKHRIYGLALSAEDWDILTVVCDDIDWDDEYTGPVVIPESVSWDDDFTGSATILDPINWSIDPEISGPYGGLYISNGYLAKLADGYSLSGNDQMAIIQYSTEDLTSTPRHYLSSEEAAAGASSLIGYSVPTQAQWETIFGTTRTGAIVNDAATTPRHYAKVTVDLTGTDYETYSPTGDATVKGILLLPDNANIHCFELTLFDTPDDDFSNAITYAQLQNLCSGAYACAFLPCTSAEGGSYLSSLLFSATGSIEITIGTLPDGKYPVRLVKNFN